MKVTLSVMSLMTLTLSGVSLMKVTLRYHICLKSLSFFLWCEDPNSIVLNPQKAAPEVSFTVFVYIH